MSRPSLSIIAVFALLLPLQALMSSPAYATSPTISATLAASPSPVNPDGTISYTAVVSNTGTAAATGVSYSDPLDARTTPVAGSLHASPIAFDQSYTAIGNTKLYVGTTPGGEPNVSLPSSSNFLVNDTAPTDSYQFVGLTGTTSCSVSTSCAITTTHGSVTGNSDGTFTYTPSAGFSGSDSFTYTLENSAVHTLTGTGTVTIAVGHRVWYVDDSKTNGSGTSTSPFNNFASALSSAASGDYIYLYKGNANYSGGTLGAGENLIGAGANLVVSGVTLVSGASGNTPTLGGTLTLANSDVVSGLNISSGASSGLSAVGISGSHLADTVSQVAVSSAGGTAVTLTYVDGAIGLTSVNANGGAHGISLSNTTGSFDIEGGGPSDPNNTTRGRTTAKLGGGTLTLGSGGTIQNATGAGVLLSNAANVTLRNMVIQNNGGTGVNNGGDGVNATNGSALVLDNDLIQGQTTNNGVHGTGVSGASFQHTEVTNNASSTSTGGTHVWNVRVDNGTGTWSVANSLFHNSLENNFGVSQTGSAAMTLNVTNSQFSDTSTVAAGNVGLQVNLQNTSNVALSIDGSSFLRNRSVGVEFLANDSAGGSFTVTNSTFDQNASGIGLAHQGAGQTINFNISNNTLNQTGGLSTPIGLNVGTQSTSTTVLQGKIQNNTIGSSSVPDSGSNQGSGIGLTDGGAGTLTATVSGNTVVQVDNEGFNFVDAQGSGPANITVTNNHFSVDNASPNSDFGQMIVDGGAPGDTGTVCANVSGNTDNGNAANGGAGMALLTEAGTPTLELQGYGGAANNASQIASFLDGANTDSPTPALVSPGAGTIKAAPANCATAPANVPRIHKFTRLPVKASSTSSSNRGRTNPVSDRARQAHLGDSEYGIVSGKRGRGPASRKVRRNDFSGNTASLTVGTLPLGKSVTIVYQATVASAPGTAAVSTQGSVSGSNFTTVNTNTANTPVLLFTSSTGVTSSPIATSNFGQSVTFTATITSGASGTPSGTVTFYDGDPNTGGVQIGAAKTLSSGQATSDGTSSLTVGSHTIYAVYGGDGRFSGSQNTVALTVIDTTPPVVSNVAVDTSGSSPVVSATVDDSRTGNSSIKAAEFFVDAVGSNGTGTAMSPVTGTFGSTPTLNVKGTMPQATYNALSAGMHTIYVHGEDSANNWSDASSTSQSFTVPAETNPAGSSPGSNPISVPSDGTTTTLLTIHVTPGLHPLSTGLAVSVDLSAVGGSATSTMYDDGTHGDVTAGDGTYSVQIT
ncbi:MAG TPA: Ig-like domain repeat protein, partial [Chloroflexota bacterium]|nr:Ig-like domain repeat protein [Chloroflexota bacterium]